MQTTDEGSIPSGSTTFRQSGRSVRHPFEARISRIQLPGLAPGYNGVMDILISVELLRRICQAFLDMQEQGAVCHDESLMEDLDKEIAKSDSQ